MSLYVGSSSANYGLKTSGLIDHNSAYTWMAWVDLVSDTNTYGHIWAAIAGAVEEWGNADWLGTDVDGVTLRLGHAISATDYSVLASTPLSIDVPVHAAIVRESLTSFKVYVGGTLEGTLTENMSGRPATGMEQIGRLAAAYPGPFRLTAIKQWQAALSADEIKAEMRTVRPLRLANLHSWHPAIASEKATALKDFSGNGRDWTEVGTVSVQPQSAPVGYGASAILLLPVAAAGNPPQLLAPTGRLGGSTWLASSGGTTYSCVDETSPDEADYAYTTTADAWEEFTFDAPDSGHNGDCNGGYVKYRIPAGSGSITVELKQGTSVLETWGPHTLTGTLQAFAQPITATTSNSSDLRVRFTAS